MLGKILSKSTCRYNQVKAMVSTASFRNCLICPGQVELTKATNEMADECWPTTPIKHEDVFRGHHACRKIKRDGVEFHQVYTDGSALRPQCRDTARAGWGVYYGNGCPHNKHAKLLGQTQNSYRGELRAALHAVETAGVRIEIVSDCKSVVNMLRNLIE